MKDCYVCDSGCTGGAIKLEVPCHQQHYGLCVTRDHAFISDALQAADEFMSKFNGKGQRFYDMRPGTPLLVEGVWADGAKRHLFYFFASKKCGKGKFLLCTECSCEERNEDGELQAVSQSGRLVHCTAFEIARRFFAVEHPGGVLNEIAFLSLDVVPLGIRGRPLSCSCWRGRRMVTREVVWPVVASRRRTTDQPREAEIDVLGQTLAEGFYNLEQRKQRAPRIAAEPKVATASMGFKPCKVFQADADVDSSDTSGDGDEYDPQLSELHKAGRAKGDKTILVRKYFK